MSYEDKKSHSFFGIDWASTDEQSNRIYLAVIGTQAYLDWSELDAIAGTRPITLCEVERLKPYFLQRAELYVKLALITDSEVRKVLAE